ncbi:hypothetical protein [Kosakonia radicincitans]|uniref:hypothetical protein n=1 Tax=Kosakonia radicincitans TaxID=283686 RepID=UPI0012AC2A6A|nr:hypothetical protein [Kosakonia radicincitans]
MSDSSVWVEHKPESVFAVMRSDVAKITGMQLDPVVSLLKRPVKVYCGELPQKRPGRYNATARRLDVNSLLKGEKYVLAAWHDLNLSINTVYIHSSKF